MTRQVPANGPVLILSPHFDDAALSCAAWLERSEPVDVLTVFGGAPEKAMNTQWDRLCGYSDSDGALRTRRAEEATAFSSTAHAVRHLDLVDGQYRPGPRTDAEASLLRSVIDQWIGEKGRGAYVLAPAGAGRVVRSLESVVGPPSGERRDQIKKIVGPLGRRLLKRANRAVTRPDVPLANGDHRFVRDVALEVCQQHDVEVWLYEELPYLWGSPADAEVAAVGRRVGRTPSEQTLAVDRSSKATRVAAYASQLTHLYAPLGPLDSVAGLPAQERYWLIAGEDSSAAAIG